MPAPIAIPAPFSPPHVLSQIPSTPPTLPPATPPSHILARLNAIPRQNAAKFMGSQPPFLPASSASLPPHTPATPPKPPSVQTFPNKREPQFTFIKQPSTPNTGEPQFTLLPSPVTCHLVTLSPCPLSPSRPHQQPP